jgi:hypothetical protein
MEQRRRSVHDVGRDRTGGLWQQEERDTIRERHSRPEHLRDVGHQPNGAFGTFNECPKPAGQIVARSSKRTS